MTGSYDTNIKAIQLPKQKTTNILAMTLAHCIMKQPLHSNKATATLKQMPDVIRVVRCRTSNTNHRS